VAKSKYSPALFEVINRQRNTGSKLDVPKWWKVLGRTAAAEPGTDTPQPTSPETFRQETPGTPAEAQENPSLTPANTTGEVPGSAADPRDAHLSAPLGEADGGTSPTGGSRADTQSEPPTGQPICQVDGGRVWISLNTVQAAIIGGVLVAALVISFGVGRLTAHAKPVDDVSSQLENNTSARGPEAPGPSMPPVAKDGTRNAEPPKRNETPATDGELKAGLRYVLFNKYEKGDRASAEYVQKWLATKHGIETILKINSKDEYLQFSKAGFDYAVPGQLEKCQELADRVKGLGKDCRKELIHADLRVYTFASPQITEITSKK
jgi:hypothetical protein